METLDSLEKYRLASLLIAGAASVVCTSATAGAPHAHRPDAMGGAAAVKPYGTQLFNLVVDSADVVDGKNYHQAGFAKRFVALLASSSLAKSGKTRVPLKKRLLSGPATQPALLADPATGRQWLVYDTCQAHRCDEISLRLLYGPASRRIGGKLNLDKQFEFLSTPSAAEQHLLGQVG